MDNFLEYWKFLARAILEAESAVCFNATALYKRMKRNKASRTQYHMENSEASRQLFSQSVNQGMEAADTFRNFRSLKQTVVDLGGAQQGRPDGA